MPALLERRLFNRDEYHTMLRAGILKEDDPVELIDGEIVRHMPSGPAHASVVKRLNRLFSRLLGDRVVVSVQDPLSLDEYSEPEPDLMLLRPRPDFYAEEHPTAVDVLLVIEVAESPLASDTGVKLPLYAEHGVREVWSSIWSISKSSSARSPPTDATRKSEPSNLATPSRCERSPAWKSRPAKWVCSDWAWVPRATGIRNAQCSPPIRCVEH